MEKLSEYVKTAETAEILGRIPNETKPNERLSAVPEEGSRELSS